MSAKDVCVCGHAEGAHRPYSEGPSTPEQFACSLWCENESCPCTLFAATSWRKGPRRRHRDVAAAVAEAKARAVACALGRLGAIARGAPLTGLAAAGLDGSS